MKKVIMLFLSIIMLLGFNNVYASSCTFNSDKNGFGVNINVDSNTLSFTGKGSYKVYSTDSTFDSCPNTIYYACNIRNVCYVGTNQNMVNKFIPTKTINGSLGLNSSNNGDPYDHIASTGDTCSAGGKLNSLVNKYLVVPIKIILPIMFLIFSTTDFVKAIFSGDKEVKKAVSVFMKRSLVMLVVYFAPNVLTLLFRLANIGVC